MNILHVEDEESIASMVNRWMKRTEHTLFWVNPANGNILDQIRKELETNQYNVIVQDINIVGTDPALKGANKELLDIVAEYKTRHPELCWIVLSGAATHQKERKLDEYPISKWLKKNEVVKTTFIEAIENCQA